MELANSLEAGTALEIDLAGILEASQPYVGQWNRLVSTTNWQKGQIIFQWRESLVGSGAGVSEFSDEAWSRLVGGVTAQHVGRLRRVYQRFGASQEKFAGLYWSHFQAALDWDDAELWLEGAVQNDWSVAEMRAKRWETLGAVAADQPRAEDIIVSEFAEEIPAQEAEQELARVTRDEPRSASFDGGGTEATTESGEEGTNVYAEPTAEPVIPFVRPFADLPELPDDLAESLEELKLCILRYKTEGWQTIARDDVLACLEALKELALAPSAE